jgi:hypothetical protein
MTLLSLRRIAPFAALLSAATYLILVPGEPRTAKHPEPFREISEVQRLIYSKSGKVAPGAVRAAIEQKRRLVAKQTSVPGAAGSWSEYGRGNLRVPGSSYDNVGARVDNFAYDAQNKRLFAAIGSGGVWMSQAVDGDVRTLGDQWVSVGDRLPTQVGSAVAWTPAAGGTLIFAGGEALMGSGTYLGLGAFWTGDLGATWNQATGVPDEALAFKAAVDQANPDIVYVATSKGLFRSDDAGRSYANVRLPTTSACAGVEALGPCQYANYVTDVVVQEPGGSTGITCAAQGCAVLAAVGFRTGNGKSFPDGTVWAPNNGLYRSATGEVDSFAKLEVSAPDNASPVGFADQDRIGRTELGQAFGPDQDHGYVYAMVQDAVLFNAFLSEPILDAVMLPAPPVPPPTAVNGLYASPDFGSSWIRMADTAELINPSTGSELSLLGLTSAVGNQTWYNQWVAIDPTRQLVGVPTRMTFGMEEIFQSRLADAPLNGIAQSGPSDFQAIGVYWGQTGLSTTTHPDQHAGIYVPTDDGGVCLFVGNDGGVAKQCVDAGQDMGQGGWGDTGTANTGIYATLPYGIAVAKDGTVWWGLQDNGSGHIEPRTGPDAGGELIMDFGADGFYAEVDPDNSDISYTESQNAGMRVTTDRGQSSAGITPSGMANFGFDNYFTMDPTDASHLMTGGRQIFATTLGPAVRGATWTQVFDLGSNPDSGVARRQTALAVLGDAAYAGYCGNCGVNNDETAFANGIATNVGGAEPGAKASPAGWHIAAAQGLDGRFITSVAIDPADARTVYATLGGYYTALRPPGSYNDPNPNIGTGNVFKSSDAGETFTDISGELPRATATSVVVRGDQLLVATEIGVFISSDRDGTVWAPLGSGLPNAPVNQIRLQPGKPQNLFAASFGRGVWIYEFRDGPIVDVPTTPDVAVNQRFGGALSLLGLLLLFTSALLRRRG